MPNILKFTPNAERGDVHTLDALIAAFQSSTLSPAEKIAAWQRRVPLEHKPLADLLLVHTGDRGHCALRPDYMCRRLSWTMAKLTQHIELMALEQLLAASDPSLPAPRHLCEPGEQGRAFALRMPGGWARA